MKLINEYEAPAGYLAVEAPKVHGILQCTGCAFLGSRNLCHALKCAGGQRIDGQSVIFVRRVEEDDLVVMAGTTYIVKITSCGSTSWIELKRKR